MEKKDLLAVIKSLNGMLVVEAKVATSGDQKEIEDSFMKTALATSKMEGVELPEDVVEAYNKIYDEREAIRKEQEEKKGEGKAMKNEKKSLAPKAPAKPAPVKTAAKAPAGAPKTEPKAPVKAPKVQVEKKDRYTRSKALFESFVEGGTREAIVARADELYVENNPGKASNTKETDFRFGMIVEVLELMKAVKNVDGNYTARK